MFIKMFKYFHYIFDIFLIVVIICIYFFGINNTSKNIGRLGAEAYNRIVDGVEGIEEGFNKNKSGNIVSKLSKIFEDYKNFFAYIGLGAIFLIILAGIIKLISSFCCCTSTVKVAN